MASLSLSPKAMEDLERLGEFLLQNQVQNATRLHATILDAIAILENHPRIGRKVGADLRELVISQGRSGYLALYRYDEEFDVVRLLRVRHQREAGYRD
ncbi:MAG: type II toxin-antitoxin system RelE/ParE family toxin [Burkholderiales bacterium]